MSLPAIEEAAYPTPQELLDQTLADIKYGFEQEGLVANVEVGSDHWQRARAYCNRASIAIRNGQLTRRDASPLTALGQPLIDMCGMFGVFKRSAAKSSGPGLVDCIGTPTIPPGYECIAPNGARLITITANTVADGDPVDLIAVKSGTAGNQLAGTILQWASSGVGGLAPTFVVGPGGIDGGEPEDDDERLRTRLLRRLAFPGVGGNWSQIAQWGEESTSSVEAAFPYPAVRGGGSYDVALTRAGGDRSLSGTITAAVASYIDGKMPGHAKLNVTSVNPQLVDVVIDLTLPLPIQAGGAGGGWRDSAPWPSTADSALARVTAVGSGTITVDSTSLNPPLADQHFGIWDPAGGDDDEGGMAEFTIASVAGVSGAYVITVDPVQSDSMAFVLAGMYCSAGALNLTTYAAEMLEQMQLLGPGEKTANPDILPRGRRHPGPDVDWPANLTNLLLARLSALHAEIADLSYGARRATGTTTPLTAPSVAVTTADAPRILVLKHLSFRRQT